MDFAEFCHVANLVLRHRKQAAGADEGGLAGALASLSPEAMNSLIGAGVGGTAGLVTGAFSDRPGSMLRHGLVGAGLGAGVGYGGTKLMDWLGSQQGEGVSIPGSRGAETAQAAALTPQEILKPQAPAVSGDPSTAGWPGITAAPASLSQDAMLAPGAAATQPGANGGGWDEGDVGQVLPTRSNRNLSTPAGPSELSQYLANNAIDNWEGISHAVGGAGRALASPFQTAGRGIAGMASNLAAAPGNAMDAAEEAAAIANAKSRR
jgi:hypothetical protein